MYLDYLVRGGIDEFERCRKETKKEMARLEQLKQAMRLETENMVEQAKADVETRKMTYNKSLKSSTALAKN